MQVSDGYHRAKAVDGSLGFAKTGTEQVAVTFELLEEPHVGQRMTWWGYFTERCADRTLESLMVAGWDGKDLARLDGLGTKEVVLVVQEEDGRPRIRWVNAPRGDDSSGSRGSMTAEQAQGLHRRLGSRIAELGGAEAPAPAPAPPDNIDDDIPF